MSRNLRKLEQERRNHLIKLWDILLTECPTDRAVLSRLMSQRDMILTRAILRFNVKLTVPDGY